MPGARLVMGTSQYMFIPDVYYLFAKNIKSLLHGKIQPRLWLFIQESVCEDHNTTAGFEVLSIDVIHQQN